MRDLVFRSGDKTLERFVSVISVDGVTSLPYVYHLLKELNISFATIVDKDYFFPNLNDTLDASRSTNGFPRYKKEFKTGTLIDEMFPHEETKDLLRKLLHENHSRAMDLLEKSNIFCFKWSLEIDLVNSTLARNVLYEILTVPLSVQSAKTLLIGYKKALKKLETVISVTRSLENSNLPNSYKRLRKSLPELIKASRDLEFN